jgi:L-rhamnose mutarotase
MGAPRRFGQVIGLRPERAANVRNYSIFRHGDLLFGYVEYVGDDLDAT